MRLRLPAPAKLNLFLHITGQREDGYHELQTLFQLLNYGDWLTLESRPEGDIEVSCPGLDIPAQDNLVYRAANALQIATDKPVGCRIAIEKHLPAGGGLGGGSSNAATILLGLNTLWELGLDSSQLCEIGLQLGADVPVFIRGHSAWAEGVGERLTEVDLPEQHFAVIAPNCAVSTAEVFSHRELTRNTPATTIAAFFEGGCVNDCENVVRALYPEVDKALIWLNNFGQARMTGTGACVFIAVEEKAEAQAVIAQKPAQWQGFVAKGINSSPVLGALE